MTDPAQRFHNPKRRTIWIQLSPPSSQKQTTLAPMRSAELSCLRILRMNRCSETRATSFSKFWDEVSAFFHLSHCSRLQHCHALSRFIIDVCNDLLRLVLASIPGLLLLARQTSACHPPWKKPTISPIRSKSQIIATLNSQAVLNPERPWLSSPIQDTWEIPRESELWKTGAWVDKSMYIISTHVPESIDKFMPNFGLSLFYHTKPLNCKWNSGMHSSTAAGFGTTKIIKHQSWIWDLTYLSVFHVVPFWSFLYREASKIKIN